MTKPDLLVVLGNKNLSSWSLRPWLVLEASGAPYREHVTLFETPGWRDSIRDVSPTGRVPALQHGDVVIWDSLAIAEYVAELFPEAQLWPADRAKRAHARAVSAEMHSGFASLRGAMSMDVVARHPYPTTSLETEADIARIKEIWTTCRNDATSASEGPYLFGRFSIADAMFAPVVFRFRTYDVPLEGAARAYADAMLAHPSMQKWERAAEEEVAQKNAVARGLEHAPNRTPDPTSAEHCYAVIFSSQRTRSDAEEYERVAQEMVDLAAKQPGFLGMESARGTDGFGITVSYWESREAIQAWKSVGDHRKAQARGHSAFYERYQVRVCSVERGKKFP